MGANDARLVGELWGTLEELTFNCQNLLGAQQHLHLHWLPLLTLVHLKHLLTVSTHRSFEKRGAGSRW